jgi:hypothetical protein
MTPDDSVRITDIYPDEDGMSSFQSDYLNQVQGFIEGCDILAVSGTHLNMLKSNRQPESYRLYEEGDYEEDDYENEYEDDEISKLEHHTYDLLNKTQVKPVVKQEEGGEPEVTREVLQSMIDMTSGENQDIEIEFQDEEGTPYQCEEHVNKIREGYSSEDEPIKIDEEQYIDHVRPSNHVPHRIEDEHLILGCIFIVIDLNTFFREIATYEETLIKLYEQIEDNEIDHRDKRVKELNDLTENLKMHIIDKISIINAEEKDIKSQITRLTTILLSAKKMIDKVDSNRFQEEYAAAVQLYNNTSKAISDLNIELLRRKDRVEELILNVREGISELLTL